MRRLPTRLLAATACLAVAATALAGASWAADSDKFVIRGDAGCLEVSE